MDAASPAKHNVLCNEIKHFEQRLVVGENGLALSHFAELAVVAFNHIGGINQFADFRRILEKGGNFAPVAPPGLNDQRIPGTPYFFEIVQGGQGRILRGCGIDGLEIRQQFFRILVGHIADRVADLMHHAFLDFRAGITGFDGL